MRKVTGIKIPIRILLTGRGDYSIENLSFDKLIRTLASVIFTGIFAAAIYCAVRFKFQDLIPLQILPLIGISILVGIVINMICRFSAMQLFDDTKKLPIGQKFLLASPVPAFNICKN